MKKACLIVLSGLALASCDKDKTTANRSNITSDNGAPYVTMQGGAMRKWDPNQNPDGCINQPQNCAPSDVIVEDHEWLWWWDDCEGHGGLHIGPVYIEWSCKTPNAPIFRTPEFKGGFLSHFKELGIQNQEQLDRLDNATFYAVLFPNLTATQRSMLYSGQYNTAIGYNKKADKYFIFVATKDKSLKEAYAKPALVIPFITTK